MSPCTLVSVMVIVWLLCGLAAVFRLCIHYFQLPVFLLGVVFCAGLLVDLFEFDLFGVLIFVFFEYALDFRLGVCFYASAFRHRRHYVFGLSVHPPKASNNLFSPVHGSIGPSDIPWLFCGMHMSVRPERFPGICQRTHGGNGLKFCMLMYLGHLQNWLYYSHGLLIFLLLASLWLSEMGQILGFRAFPREPVVGMAWNFACWCILTTFRTEKFMVMVCWYF